MFHFSYQRHPPNVADKLCTYLDHEALKSAIVQVRNQSLIGGIMKFILQKCISPLKSKPLHRNVLLAYM